MEKEKNEYIAKILKINIVILATIISFISFILPYIGDKIYYNPNGNIKNSYEQTEMFINTKVFTELHYPEDRLSYNTINSLGYGRYSIVMGEYNLMDGLSNSYTIIVNKGEVEGNSFSKEKFASEGKFYNVDGRKQLDKRFMIAKLKKAPEETLLQVYVSFKNLLSIDDMLILTKKYNIKPKWIAVKTSEYQVQKIGFAMDQEEVISEKTILDDGRYLNEAYPYLLLNNNGKDKATGFQLKNHFRDLLKYIDEQNEFKECFLNKDIVEEDFYKNSLNYIKENGIKTYGILIQCDVQTILKIIDDENIIKLFIDDAVHLKHEHS